MCTSQKPLPITFVTKEESGKREQWFNNFKYPILNIITLLQEGVQENYKLDFEDIQSAIVFFKQLTTNLKEEDGVRMYFASPSADGTVKKDKCGLLTIIFCATIGAEKSDIKNYYTLSRKTVIPIQEDRAREWVHNYQNVKRKILFETLSDSDRLNNCKETKHVWFSLQQMRQTINEMECQSLNQKNIVTGFGIRFVSYTNQDYYFPKPKPSEFEKRQRLTIAFTFTNALTLDIGIEDIDKEVFEQRLETTINGFFGDTFDTGFPAPPPSGDGSMAALDIEN